MSSNWRSKHNEAMSEHPLIAVEINWHRDTSTLEREIKRLRSEVGLMPKQYHGEQREIRDMAGRLRAQPPPPVPERLASGEEQEQKEKEDMEMADADPSPKAQGTESPVEGKKTPPPLPPPPPEKRKENPPLLSSPHQCRNRP